MTDDIVIRLREGKGDDTMLFGMMYEAADEIERLRKMAYVMIDELRQNGGYEPYTTQMLFNEFYQQAVRGE